MGKALRRWAIAVAVCALLVVGAMLFIFFNSQEDAAVSSSKSSFFADLMAKIFLPPDPGADALARFESDLREAAHFFEFFVLGMVAASLVVLLIRFDKKKWPFLLIGYAGCVAYALADEWHQNFIPGRAAEWKDVLIDSLGSLAGTLLAAGILLTLVLRIISSRRKTEQRKTGPSEENSEKNEPATTA